MSKQNDGKAAEKAIKDTFSIYFMSKRAQAVKVETQYRVAWIPDKQTRKPTRSMVKIKQNLDDFVGCLIPSGRMLFLGVKSDAKPSLSTGLKDHGIKQDQLANLLKWSKAGAISRVLWLNEGTWFQIPASILSQATMRGGPIHRDELSELGLEVDDSKGFVDFLALSEEETKGLTLSARKGRRTSKPVAPLLGLTVHPLPSK